MRFRVGLGLIAVQLMLAPNTSQAEATCTLATLSPRIAQYRKVMETERLGGRSWANHSLSDYPTFVFDVEANPQCIALFQPAVGWKAVALENKIPVDPSNDMDYGSIEAGTTFDSFSEDHQAAMAEINRVREQNGIRSAYYFGWIGPRRPSGDVYGVSSDRFPSEMATDMALATHEAFHYMYQTPARWLSGHARSSTDCSHDEPGLLNSEARGVGRLAAHIAHQRQWTEFADGGPDDEDLHQCYDSSPRLKALHQKEIDSLTNALAEKDPSKAKQLVRQFLSYREQRYSLKPNFIRRTYGGRRSTESCRLGEAKLELHEGVPEFVGDALMLDAKLATEQQVSLAIQQKTRLLLGPNNTAVESRPIHSYYHTGSLSLLLIRRFYSGNFLDKTREISQRDSKVILSDLLKEVVDGTSP